MESVQNQKESCEAVEHTAEEQQLAEKYQVEPKLIRLVAEIVSEHTAGITELIKLMRAETDQKVEAKLEEIETPEELQEPTELTISEQTMERLKDFYKNLDPRIKLAIVTLSEIQSLDGINFQISEKSEDKLYGQICDDLESVCLETFHRESDHTALGVIDSVAGIGKTNEDVWLAGVWEAVRMVIQNT